MPVNIIGYSAGGDSALLYAARLEENLPINSVVLIDPGFGSSGMTSQDYYEIIQRLSDAKVPVLLVDTTMLYSEPFYGAEVLQFDIGHMEIDDDPNVKNNILGWIEQKQNNGSD